MRSEVIRRNVARNGAGHDESRDGEAPGRGETDGKMHNEDPKKWGNEMKPKWDAAPET
jgi:hypothetical protein